MKRDEVLRNVRVVICDQLGIQPDEINEDDSWGMLGADSLDEIELLMALEEEINQEVPEDDFDKLATVSAAVTYICQKKGITE